MFLGCDFPDDPLLTLEYTSNHYEGLLHMCVEELGVKNAFGYNDAWKNHNNNVRVMCGELGFPDSPGQNNVAKIHRTDLSMQCVCVKHER